MASTRTQEDGAGFVDKMAQYAIRQHSRRGFLGALGKAGLVLVGLTGGLGLAPHLTSAEIGITCPPPCLGDCILSGGRSCCYSGPEKCEVFCPCFGGGYACQADGRWNVTNGVCTFHCYCITCP